MATHLLKIAFVTCLLSSIPIQELKPVLAKTGERLQQRTTIKETILEELNKMEKSMVVLKEKIQTLEECKAPAAAGLEDSEILKTNASYLKVLSEYLNPVVQSNSHWKRCWRASLDGWAAATFHANCDDKGPTVTIIRVGKYIFGGYTSASWTSRCQWPYDSAAFLFSLVNEPGWQPLKLNQTGKYSSYRCCSIYSCSSHGPTFGNGYDIYIADHASSNTNSGTNLGVTYGPPSGYSYGSSDTRRFLAGSLFFQPDEVEVFFETT
ncbi:uncharacterized protein LOC144664796 [Oculina patagonica]